MAQFYGTAITELDRNVILAGTHDCGTLRLNDGTSWSHVYGGDGGTTMFDYSNSGVAFCEYNTSPLSLLRSTNRGISFSSTSVVDLYHYNSPVIQDPNNPDVMYAGSIYMENKCKLIRSTDKGISFTQALNN